MKSSLRRFKDIGMVSEKTSQHINFQKWHNLEILQILVASIGFLVVGRYFELQVTF